LQKNTSRHILLAPISNFLKVILGKYLNEIKMPINIPLQLDLNGGGGGGGGSHTDSSDEHQSNIRIFNALKEKMKATSTSNDIFSSNETTTNFTLSETNLENSLSANFFDSQVKLDIYKTVYDYFFYTILNKYYVFYFDANDACNERESRSRTFKAISLRTKPNFDYFKLSEINTNEQYKSILNVKCYKFISVDYVMND
jgi:hypothetical protein